MVHGISYTSPSSPTAPNTSRRFRRLCLVLLGISHKIISPQAKRDDASRDPASINKPPPAVLDILQIHPLDHDPQRNQRTSAAPNEKRWPGTRRDPRPGQQRHLRHGQSSQHLLRLLVVLQRDALDARLGVILDVHVCVNHVVHHRPRHVRGVQQRCPGLRRAVGQQVHAQRGEAHDCAPGKGQAENELRVVGDALHEGICCHEEQARRRVEEAGSGELEQDGEPGQELPAGEDKPLEGGDSAAGDGAQARARDVWVEIAVPEVVDGAACAAHDDGSRQEEEGGGEDCGGGGHGGGAGEGEGCREEGGEDAGEEEIVGAGGLVEANEFGVGDPGGGEVGEEAGFGRGVRFEGW